MKQEFYRNNERGASLTEFALVLPILLMVTFGILECGRLMLAYTTLADAARAATRYAIVHGINRSESGVDGPSGPGNTDNVEAVAKDVTGAAGLPSSGVTVDVQYPNGSNDIGSPVTVSVSYDFHPIALPLMPLAVTLGSESEGMICF